MKSLLSALRYVLTICLCAVLLFASVAPSALAQAVVKDKPMANEPSSSTTKAAKEYEGAARETIDKGGLQSLEEVRDRTKGGGLNEVQGTAGFDEMKRPSNTGATSIEEQIEKGLQNADKAPGKVSEAVQEAPGKLTKEAKKAQKQAEKAQKQAEKEAKKLAKQTAKQAEKATKAIND
ncbi:hypothetical protein [Leptolyngbya sp. NIES-2104]|uniref:hypothetical protein n=1 Tax=Leptolyngbya sp. NIES-2104 TaxID=1552121 RepID=UPI00073E78C8|nr:hypothetical protein [Leptolyngbya sp. NIES-2104]